MQNSSPKKPNLSASDLDSEGLSGDLWGPGRRLWSQFSTDLMGQGPDKQTPRRLVSHFAILIVALGILLISRVDLPQWEIERQPVLPAPPASPTPVTLSQLVVSRGGSVVKSSGPLIRSAVPFTTIPDRPRLDIVTYVVQPGDTVFGIADRFSIKPETIMWANRDLELNPDMLRVNDELIILPINGVYHEVKKKDTLVKIAKKYNVQPTDITRYVWNNLENEGKLLEPGAFLIVPGGEKPFISRTVSVYSGPIPDSARKGSGTFAWPSSGAITEPFWKGHRALDIGSWVGSPVVASDSGYVIYAGWDHTGYGNLIIIDHGNGYRTYYAHLSRIFVRTGESVGQGQRIGSVGSSGNSTGPHLHFEIRVRNVNRNPFGFLR